MSQVKIKDYSNYTPCYECDGKGYLGIFLGHKKCCVQRCPTCKGTGKYKNERYLLTAVDPRGQTIGFEVDDRGK